MKKIFLFVSLLIAIQAASQPSATYYDAAEGKTSSELKTTLYSIISSGYVSKSYDYLYTIYETSDVTASGKVWDMYSTCDWDFGKKLCGNYSVICDCQNREHSIPQSWFGSKSPMVSDAFHVYPTDGKVNGIRSSFPFGETNALPLGGKALGKLGSSSFSGYSGTVFEPIDEYKGDFARTYFYFATRYENIMTTIGGESFNKTVYPSFPSWVINLFLKWHRNDPVSQKEIDRNNAVFFYQKNRNPFIDYPNLAEFIWGDKKGIPWSKNFNTGPQILTPANNSIIDLGNIPYQQSSSVVIDVKAANLTGDLSLSLSGTNGAMFSISTTSITKTDAEVGYKLTVSCNPQILGVVNAVMNISGGGITPAKVNLKASSTDSFMALEASEITLNSFKANWTTSANATDYLLNVFSKQVTGTQSKNILVEDFNNGIPSSWTTSGYTDTQTTSNVRLASGSQDGILTTPPIDLSTNTVLTILAKQWTGDTYATLRIDVNSDSITTIPIGADYEYYYVQIPETGTNSTIKFTAKSGKTRVFVDYIKVATEGSIETPVSLAGYPKLVGNMLNYTVTDLPSDSTLFYTVTPQGNGALTSDEIIVKTLAPTGLSELSDLADVIVYFKDNTLYLSNIEKGDNLIIYSVLGNKILDKSINSDQVSFPFNYKGIYILQVIKENKVIGNRKLLFN